MYAVILIPSFRLQSALRWREELCSKPVAVVDTKLQKSVILECNKLAAQYGLNDGMNCSQGLARCPGLVLLSRVESEELAGQSILLEIGFSLTPELEETGQGCLTLDLSKIKIEDYSNWATDVIARFSSLRFTPTIGIGPNPDLAYLAAKKADSYLLVTKPEAFLNNLHVYEIEPNEKLVSLLYDWGISTLAQLVRLPRTELSARLGQEAGTLWLKAKGKTQRLLKLAKQSEELSEAYEFEYNIETIEPLYFIINRFLKDLSLRLEAINRVASKIELAFMLDNVEPYKRVFSIPAPTKDPTTLFRILNTHLEALTLTQPITGIKLLVIPTMPDNSQLRLFDNAIKDIGGFLETLARIIAVVGNGNVGVASITDSNKPDSFIINEPKFDKLPEAVEESHVIGLPLKRFRPPIPAQVWVEHHTPVAIKFEKGQGRIVDMLGPYRASGNWWENGWGNEEWDIEISGRGLFRISRQNEDWQVEGCYGA